jgi:hypothetical protein
VLHEVSSLNSTGELHSFFDLQSNLPARISFYCNLIKINKVLVYLSLPLKGRNDPKNTGILSLGFSCKYLNRSDQIITPKHIVIDRSDCIESYV